jgi:predicted AAA+ superfamily ATPase
VDSTFIRSLILPKDRSFFLFGPRQVGKSTLLRDSFSKEKTIFIDLLLASDYQRYLKRPDLLKDEILARDLSITHVVIDEIQRVPELLNIVHYLIENDKSNPRFVLSGSSARKLKRGQANLLAGRALSYSLYPLNFLELGTSFDLNKALDYGTLPAIYLEKDAEIRKEKLKAYCGTYLREEIQEEALLRNLASFMSFLDFVAEENGNQINYSNISTDIGVSANTVKEYFQILEDTLIGFFLLPFTRSIRKRLSKRPKFYLFDMGAQRALANSLSLASSEGNSSFGKSFEHFIIREIISIADTFRTDFKFSYYRTSSGLEVDLIAESPSRGVFAIEIKAKDVNIKPKDLRGLESFAEEVPKARLICCSLSPRRRKEGNVLILPWRELFKELGLEP